MNVGLHVKYAVLVSHFNLNWNVLQSLVKSQQISWKSAGFLQKEMYTCRHDEPTTATFCCEHTIKEQGYENFVTRYCCVRQDNKDGKWTAEKSKRFTFSPPINKSTPPASVIFLSNSSHSSWRFGALPSKIWTLAGSMSMCLKKLFHM